MNITDPGDTVNVTLDGNLPAGYIFETTGTIYTLTITITSVIEDITFTVLVRDSMGAATSIQPQVTAAQY